MSFNKQFNGAHIRSGDDEHANIDVNFLPNDEVRQTFSLFLFSSRARSFTVHRANTVMKNRWKVRKEVDEGGTSFASFIANKRELARGNKVVGDIKQRRNYGQKLIEAQLNYLYPRRTNIYLCFYSLTKKSAYKNTGNTRATNGPHAARQLRFTLLSSVDLINR